MDRLDFYIYDRNLQKFEPVLAELVTIPDYEDFTFFVHLDTNYKIWWNVTEGLSGATISTHSKTKEEAIEKAIKKLETLKPKDIEGLITEWVFRHGINPMFLSRLLPTKRKA